MKYEDVCPKEYGTPREARIGINGYLRYYNEERLHQSLGYRTPEEVYFDTQEQIFPNIKI